MFRDLIANPGVWIGFFALLLGLAYMAHRERMALIEKGLYKPRKDFELPRYNNTISAGMMIGGLVTGGIGLAISLGIFWAAGGNYTGWMLFGLIPLGVGVGLIFGSRWGHFI